MELYLKDGKFVGENEWIKIIDGLKENIHTQDKKKLKSSILSAVKNRIPSEKFGIFFSGGIDSSTIAMICRNENADFICYTVGFDGSEDIKAAKKAADILGIELRIILLDMVKTECILSEIKKILNLGSVSDDKFTIVTEVVAAGVGTVIYAAANAAKDDNINLFFSGLGSEEIFGGYDRHMESEDVNEECWNGLRRMWKRDLIRDYTLSQKMKFRILTPYLDRNVIVDAMSMPGSTKIKGDIKKAILREISEDLGMHKEISGRPKKAAQYGSRVNKAIEHLAKKNGFKYKQDYLRSL